MTTKTTMHLGRAASWLDRQQIPPALVVAALVFLVAGGISGIGRLRSNTSAAAVPTPGLVILIATQRAIVPPTAVPPVQVAAAPSANMTRRAIVVYGDHDLATAIGAVEAGRAFTPLDRYGAEWMRVNMSGTGLVYVRTADLYDMPADLVDLAPAPAPAVVYVSAPAEGALAVATPEIYQTTNAPLPPSSNRTPAQEAERQRNIEARLANQYIYPTLAPMEENEVTKEWARQQEAAEHGQQPLTLSQMPCHCP